MRLGILSDTHDRLDRTRRAVAALSAAGAEALVHCGDLTRPEVVDVCGELTTYYVFGNNDADEAGLRRAMALSGGVCLGHGGMAELGGRRVAVAHGDLIREINRLADSGPDYLLYGHTHQRSDERRGPIRWINPGALHRAPAYTVALLDLATDSLRTIVIEP